MGILLFYALSTRNKKYSACPFFFFDNHPPSICIKIYESLWFFPFFCLLVQFLFVHLSVRLSVCLPLFCSSAYLSVCFPFHSSTFLSFCLFLWLLWPIFFVHLSDLKFYFQVWRTRRATKGRCRQPICEFTRIVLGGCAFNW